MIIMAVSPFTDTPHPSGVWDVGVSVLGWWERRTLSLASYCQDIQSTISLPASVHLVLKGHLFNVREELAFLGHLLTLGLGL